MTTNTDPRAGAIAEASAILALADAERRDLTEIEAREIDRLLEQVAATISSRGDLERHLRSTGLSRAAARAVAAGGWRALSPKSDAAERRAAILNDIRAARARLRSE